MAPRDSRPGKRKGQDAERRAQRDAEREARQEAERAAKAAAEEAVREQLASMLQRIERLEAHIAPDEQPPPAEEAPQPAGANQPEGQEGNPVEKTEEQPPNPSA